MKKIIFLIALTFFLPSLCLSREESKISDWYVKDFHSKIEVKEDSSLLITESILADCGNLTGKHGIFRTLPFEIKIDSGGSVKTPIKLVSITDFSGNNIPYSETKSYSDKTVTWKIGDAQKTVKGENEYRIIYKVKNAIRFQENFDEFYWNLSGNFWQLEIDRFSSEIIFPQSINKNNTQIDYFAGRIGSKSKKGAQFSWEENILSFEYTKTLLPGEGVTTSVVLPQGIFEQYKPSFWEKYSFLILFFFPLLVFGFCFMVWKKYGKDPKWDKTIIPEFEIPEKLSPGEMIIVEKSGGFENEIITASLVNLAVMGVIKIEEIEKKGIFGKKDFKIKLVDESKLEKVSKLEKSILDEILERSNEKKISQLRNKFQKKLQKIKKIAFDEIVSKGYITKAGTKIKIVFFVLAFFSFFSSFFFLEIFPYFSISLILSALIFFIFAFLMPKRTVAGAEMNWRIQGFKLYMKTAEKYRQQFNEKENIFEKFLPYAIVFGMTKIWINKMKEIYGQEYFSKYKPVWYTGISSNGFDASSFLSSVESVSSAIATNVSSSSGSGGGGFSGGGGGGGGGGGW